MACSVGLAMLAIMGVLRLSALLDLLNRKRRERTAQERRRRWPSPDWDGVSRALGDALIPKRLKELYGDHVLILEHDFRIIDPREPDATWHINQFLPAISQNVVEPDLKGLPERFFAFACDAAGDMYFMKLNALSDEDGPIFLAQHDSKEVVCLVAPSLEAFLSWPREYPKTHRKSLRLV